MIRFKNTYQGLDIEATIEPGAYTLTTKYQDKDIEFCKYNKDKKETITVLNNNKVIKINRYFGAKPFITAYERGNNKHINQIIKIKQLPEIIKKYSGINIDALDEIIEKIIKFTKTDKFTKPTNARQIGLEGLF